MQGCTIYVMKRIGSNGGKAQVTGIDTKYVKEQITVELGADMYLLVSPYKEINKEPLWRRVRRQFLIWEANARLWIASRAERGQSDIQTRIPVPVTDAEFHAPLTSSSVELSSRPAATPITTSAQAGCQEGSTPTSESPESEYFDSTPDMWWKCERCHKMCFLGMCSMCRHVTQF